MKHNNLINQRIRTSYCLIYYFKHCTLHEEVCKCKLSWLKGWKTKENNCTDDVCLISCEIHKKKSLDELLDTQTR